MTVKLQVGLTELTDSLVNGTITYNVAPGDEKAQLEWDLHTDIPAVSSAVSSVKAIYELPHVNIIDYTTDSDFETLFMLEVAGLFPEFGEETLYTDADYESLVAPRKTYGGLYLNPRVAYAVNGSDFNRSSEYAVFNNTLETYSVDAVPAVTNSFVFNFLDSAKGLAQVRIDDRVETFITDNQAEMNEREIDVTTFLKTYGRILAGTLVNDPDEARDVIQKYPCICRVEIIE